MTDLDCPSPPDPERTGSEAIIKENKMGSNPEVPRGELRKVPDLGNRIQKH